jgi:hypothetical protein
MGRSYASHVTGRTNHHVPHMVDVVPARALLPVLPINIKPIGAIHTDVLTRLSLGTPHEAEWRRSVGFLTDVRFYTGVPPVNLSDARTSITKEQCAQVIAADVWGPVEDLSRIRGVVRVFGRPELWKVPPRTRVLHWTYTTNLWVDWNVGSPKMRLISLIEVRQSVHRGSHAFSIDGKNYFNQFLYSADVSYYFCVLVGAIWYRLLRLAMGMRQACLIADTSLQVISAPMHCWHGSYIDNLLGVGSPDLLLADLGGIRLRSAEANLTWNEDLGDPNSLIKTEVEYIGLVLNFTLKAVRLAPKVLAKLGCTWARRAEWTVRDFISHVCILFYCWSAVGKPFQIGIYQYVLQVWARAQGDILLDLTALTASFQPPDDSDFWPLLEAWTMFHYTNEYVAVPDPATAAAEDDYIVCSDSSKIKFAGIIISLKSNQATVVAGYWPPSMAEAVKSSAFAEPLGLVAICNSFFLPGTSARVRYYGDNAGFVRQLLKGYSTKGRQIALEYLARKFPNIIFSSSEHYEGSRIPMDEPSREVELDAAKLAEFFERVGIAAPFIRVESLSVPLEPKIPGCI